MIEEQLLILTEVGLWRNAKYEPTGQCHIRLANRYGSSVEERPKKGRLNPGWRVHNAVAQRKASASTPANRGARP